jgi:hypothetical protein
MRRDSGASGYKVHPVPVHQIRGENCLKIDVISFSIPSEMGSPAPVKKPGQKITRRWRDSAHCKCAEYLRTCVIAFHFLFARFNYLPLQGRLRVVKLVRRAPLVVRGFFGISASAEAYCEICSPLSQQPSQYPGRVTARQITHVLKNPFKLWLG